MCDIENVNTEWQLLCKQEIYSKDVTDFWNQVLKLKNTFNSEMFPHLSVVIKAILALPPSSAAPERGFSGLSLSKTQYRNRLQIRTCASILIVRDYIRSIGGIKKWELPKLSCMSYTDAYLEKINIAEDDTF